MIVDHKILEEINLLWKPIYPFLVKDIVELYGRSEGSILEIGPFAGLIFELAARNVGDSFCIATFVHGTEGYFIAEASRRGLRDRITIRHVDPSLESLEEGGYDLIVFRGAFFFPSLFQPDLPRVYQLLRQHGIALVGGGFGKHTPLDLIEKIGKRSRELNLMIGKTRIGAEKLQEKIGAAGLAEKATLLTEGGLWIVLKK